MERLFKSHSRAPSEFRLGEGAVELEIMRFMKRIGRCKTFPLRAFAPKRGHVVGDPGDRLDFRRIRAEVPGLRESEGVIPQTLGKEQVATEGFKDMLPWPD